jgi:alpha-methylacyl-CoA racemase
MTVFHGAQQSGFWSDERGTNLLDTGSHFYDAYETADGGFVSIGSIEPQFYAELLKRIGVEAESLPAQLDRARWPEAKEKLARLFKTRTRAQWCALLEGSDACFAPVLSMAEARRHPHNVARGVFVEVAGVEQPRPAPRFSRTDSAIQRPPARAGEHTDEALADWGFAPSELAALRDRKAIA